jgi:hypothetical protein
MNMRFDETVRILVLMSIAVLTSACATVPLAPGAAQVRLTRDAADVASCRAIGNVAGDCSPESQKRTSEATLRNATISAGANAVLVTREWAGMVCGGIAYECH